MNMNSEQPYLGLVVVVDDDDLVTRPVKRVLRNFFNKEQLPYEIVTSQEPLQVLAELEKTDSELALVISDIKMAPMDGLEFLRAIKNRYPDTMLLTLTGFATESEIKLLREEFELFSHMEKPWKNAHLERTIKSALVSHRQKILLNRYVPKNLLETILNQAYPATIESIEAEATILFLDFRGTADLFQNEHFDIKSALQHLNLYFNELIPLIEEFENGILDKFIGSGLMAIFGVPHSASPAIDAQNAVRSAIKMKERTHQMNQRIGHFPLAISIGISTGTVVLGNVGTETRANYTVLGKDVRLASLLEKKSKSIRDGILISENTYRYVKDLIEVSPLPISALSDSLADQNAYEVLGLS